MFFSISFKISLAIFVLGTLYRIINWFRFKIGTDALSFTMIDRIKSGVIGIFKTIFSLKIFSIIKVLILDVVLQIKIIRADKWRWIMHMCIFYGFMLLLLMHAFENQITKALFKNYASTLNPFMFLRNLFGAIVIFGVLIAVLRRKKTPKILTNAHDSFAIFLLFSIMLSGFVLEGLKIISSPIFDEMVSSYISGSDDITPLKAYWAKKFHVVFKEKININDEKLLSEGESSHIDNCASCHSMPETAFISYPFAVSFKHFGNTLNDFRVDRWLWYFHVLSCFLGLAYLPFSKFFHILSTPINLLLEPAEEEKNKVTSRIIGMDACTHCGVCTENCSVAQIYQVTQNPNILPSEKLASIKLLSRGKKVEREKLNEIAEGSFICTNCYRCTKVCPSGINLDDLWTASKNTLIQQGYFEPHNWIAQKSPSEWAETVKKKKDEPSDLIDNPEIFYGCVQCSTCASVCPVVAASNGNEIDLTPQQVMNLLRMGLKDLAMASKMVWNCTTCYMCEENCPQGIRVTDIFYELRNKAYIRFKDVKENV
ncbi:MAG: 4Fe-4S dicluster domain-containing protein [Desulfobacterales bacterium]|nr:4Fe-4S dicluster domain-containing protein [Desulfobacterales bacterium]MBF0397699.1 4Fe-4S dicluster domain-containing protein [Desulfobacterales bacterium]